MSNEQTVKGAGPNLYTIIAAAVQTMRDTPTYYHVYHVRIAGVLEGLLKATGALSSGQFVKYQTVDAPNPNPFAWLPWVKKRVKRKERYDEAILRLATKWLEDNHEA